MCVRAGPILMDGSLVEWLISSGHEKELRLLLHLRPSVALLELSRLSGMEAADQAQFIDTRKTPFELAILLRRDKTLEALLHAAARYAKCGEPAMAIASKAGTSKKQGVDAQVGKGLLPPAMRRVTDCLRDALRSQDHMMADVLRKFLMTLEPVSFDTPAKYLPRTLETRFLGSPSPSLLLSNPEEFDLNAPLWCQSEGMHVPAGFPSSASVVMLPGLTSYSVLDILAQQEAAFLYTPPVRSLIDALKTNGIQAEFYRQSYLFVVLFLSFILMVFSLVMDAQPGIDTYSPDKIRRNPRVVVGLVAGLISFVLAIKFLFNEANELIESTDDVVDIDTQREEILRMEESFIDEAEDLVHLEKAGRTDLEAEQHRKTTDLEAEEQRARWMQRRATQRLFPADEVGKSTKQLHLLNKHALHSAKGSVGGGDAFLFGSSSGGRPKKCQHPAAKLLERRSEDTIRTSKGARVHPTHDAGAGSPQATPRPCSGTQVHFTSNQSVCLIGGQSIASSPAWMREESAWEESAGQLKRCHTMPVAGKPKKIGTMARVARTLRSLDIDVTYFQSGWNAQKL